MTPRRSRCSSALGRSGLGLTPSTARALRRRHFHFDPVLKRMATVDERDGRLWVHAKGAPEQLLAGCTPDPLARRTPNGSSDPISFEP